jgi:hypothetical protein
VSAAVQSTDLAEVKAAATKITTIAKAERSWLLAHPAKTCYAPYHDAAFEAYGELLATSKAITDDANAGDANGIHRDVASGHGEVAALRQAGNRAVAACP